MKVWSRTGGRWTSLAFGVVLAATVGCKSSPIALHLLGEPQQNRRNSVVVPVYQLYGRLNFEAADIASFWRDDAAPQGAQLLYKKAVAILPGYRQTRPI